MLSDLTYALRQLRLSPGFTAVAVLILALGIGANTAIFNVINAVLLSALPVKDPQGLVFLTNPNMHGFITGANPGKRQALTYAEFEYLRDHNSALSGLLAVSAQNRRFDAAVTVDQAGKPKAGGPLSVSLVSGDYFSVLGVRAALGRTFTAAADRVRDANPVVVISYAYWQRQFLGDPGVLGRKIRLGDTLYDIIGVAQPGFFGETFGLDPSVWVPLTMQAEIVPGTDLLSAEKNPGRKQMWLQVIGRIKPGLSVEQARASLNLTFRQYLETQLASVPQEYQSKFLDETLGLTEGGRGGSTLRESQEAPLVLLMALVTLLLLIACANVANLLLARATFRQREIAIRVAIGARPNRIFRQLLVESLLLSAIGGLVGLLFAQWGDAALLRLAGGGIAVHQSPRILAFTLGVSLLVGVLFGVAPAWRAARVDLNSVLKGVGAGPAAGRFSLGSAFVVTQVALSLLLLIVAGLFVHSFQKLSVTSLGYDRDHLVQFRVSARGAGYRGAATKALYDKLAGRLRVIPGVQGVTLSDLGLLSGGELAGSVSIEGYSPTAGQVMQANTDSVGPSYFTTVGIPILLGRDLTEQDETGGQRVGLINQTMARYYFAGANPLGRRINDFIVIGVVADTKQHNAKEIPARRFFIPFFNSGDQVPDAAFEVRTGGDPASVISAIRTAVQDSAPNLPSIGIQTINQIADHQLNLDRLLTKLSGFFGLLAAVLASTGIYGILSYAVARRTREIGIRMALGAQRGNVIRLILRDALLLVLAGAAIGVPATLGAGKLISGLLYGVTSADPLVLVAAVLLMIGVAAVAGYFPAWRASRIDPLEALRAE